MTQRQIFLSKPLTHIQSQSQPTSTTNKSLELVIPVRFTVTQRQIFLSKPLTHIQSQSQPTSTTNKSLELVIPVRFTVTQRQIFLSIPLTHISLVMRKLAFFICENKDADQLRVNREADQRLCFRYTDSTIPLLPQSEMSSLYPSSVAVQTSLCGTWSETPKTGFLTTRLI